MLWKQKWYWQYPKQQEGFIPLTEALDNHSVNVDQRVAIARETIKLIHALHDQQFAQAHLTPDDIFVTESNQVIIRIRVKSQHKILANNV